MRAGSDMKLIGKAGNAPYYYIFRKTDTAMGEELNNALDQIEIEDPNFQTDLIDKYFPIYRDDPYSKEELDYIEELPVLKIAIKEDRIWILKPEN